MPKRTQKDLSQLTQTVETQVTPLLEPAKEQDTTHRATRVGYIPLGQILPDRFQSRVILPPKSKKLSLREKSTVIKLLNL